MGGEINLPVKVDDLSAVFVEGCEVGVGGLESAIKCVST